MSSAASGSSASSSDADGTVQSINDFPWTGTQVMDMDFGPDGALYVLDYGTAWFGGDENSALYRIENATDGHSPVAAGRGGQDLRHRRR